MDSRGTSWGLVQNTPLHRNTQGTLVLRQDPMLQSTPHATLTILDLARQIQAGKVRLASGYRNTKVGSQQGHSSF